MKAFQPFLPSRRLHPGLLISPNFESTGCNIYVTDGSYLWKQTITPSELQKLSSTYDSPIDVEDPEQLKILFEKLRQGLLWKGYGGNGIKTELFQGSEGSFTHAGVPKKLVIHTNVPLDAPLAPLDWRFYLDLTSQTEFTTTVTIPLLRLVGLYQTKANELLEQIKAKDAIITKLKDYAELQKKGAVLEIFHNKRSRHGLMAFDKEEWKNSFLRDGENANMDWLYESEEDPKIEFEAVLGEEERINEGWWDTLAVEKKLALSRQNSKDSKVPIKSSPKRLDEKRPSTVSPKKPKKRGAAPRSVPADEMETDDEPLANDDIVWTPELPKKELPSLNERLKPPPPPPVSKSATIPKDPDDPYATASEDDDDDDLDKPISRGSSKPMIERNPSPKPTTRGGLGRLGAVRARQRTPTPKETTPPPKVSAGKDDDETASEDEGTKKQDRSLDKPSSSEQTTVGFTSPAKPKTKLGALGRKATPEAEVKPSTLETPKPPSQPKTLGKLGGIGSRRPKETTGTDNVTSTQETPIQPPQTQTLGRLGGIGGRHKEATNPSHASPSTDQKTPPENTTIDPLEQEAADRKRKELERALEEKKKGPVRKKRKF